MIGLYLALHHHIINVNFDLFPLLKLKYPNHRPLIGSPGILQTKGHHLIVIISSRSDKSCLLLVIHSQRYLMVPLKGIEKTHPRMAHSCIHQLVNSSHRERVLWAGFIQVCKVYTYSPFPSLLFYHYCISQPFKVEDFFNSPSLLELRHLVLDNIRVFLR